MDYPVSDPTVGLVGGKFSDGDAVGGVSASRDPAAWANAVTDELLAIIAAAGLTPDEEDLNQVLDALVLLGLRSATSTLTGVVELATDAEAVAGASAVLAVSPAGLLAALTAFLPKRTFNANDYIRIPDVPGGLIIQWGNRGDITAGSTAAVTYPVAFPVGMDGCSVSPSYSITGAGAAYMSHINTSASILTINNTGSVTCAARWLAIGR